MACEWYLNKGWSCGANAGPGGVDSRIALSAPTVELPGMPALAVAADAARRTHAVPLAWTSSVSRRRLCGLT